MELALNIGIVVMVLLFIFIGYILWEDRTYEIHKESDIDDELEEIFNSKNKNK